MMAIQSVREQILSRLAIFQPSEITLSDDSAAHRGHAGADSHADRTGAIDGTHFELTIVSAQFIGKPLVARHRMIYETLADLMKTQIHALRIDARSG
jgi:BolA family transcriptional regulator, general stress-responsive regulator